MNAPEGKKLREWQKRLKKEGGICNKCGDTRVLTVDHVVPVNLITQLLLPEEAPQFDGANFEEDFQVLCVYCNYRKAGRLDPKNPKTYRIMRKLLDAAEKYHINPDGRFVFTGYAKPEIKLGDNSST